MLLPVSLAMAQGRGEPNHPVEMTFTKWVTAFPLMEGFWGDDLANHSSVILQRQVSQRQADACYLPAPNCGRIIRLEAIYEIQAGDHSFTALIRGGRAATPARPSWTAPSCSGGAPAPRCTWNSRRYPARPAA